MTDWITNRPPSYRDADPEQLVIVSTDIDFDCWSFMHWSRAAQGNLPWRHTSRWVDREPPAPVIVTPEQDPEAAARGFRVGQMWRTRKGKICKIVMITNDKNLPINTDLHKSYWHRPNGGSCLATNDQDHEDDLIELISENSPTPAAPEPQPEPKPEPEKAARGFAQITTVLEDENIKLQIAIATDGTAWHRFVVRGDWDKWEQIQPLPQPGEE